MSDVQENLSRDHRDNRDHPKVELQPEVLVRRYELSTRIAAQLKDDLNTVIPVAAGANGRKVGILWGETKG